MRVNWKNYPKDRDSYVTVTFLSKIFLTICRKMLHHLEQGKSEIGRFGEKEEGVSFSEEREIGKVRMEGPEGKRGQAMMALMGIHASSLAFQANHLPFSQFLLPVSPRKLWKPFWGK